MSTEMRGRVQTVRGLLDPDDLGITSTHEHLFLDLGLAWLLRPKTAFGQAMSREPVRLDNLWWIKRNAMSNEDNLRLTSYDEAVDEILQFAREGGVTIVDCTTRGLAGDPRLLKAVSIEANLQVVAGAGYYIAASHPPEVSRMSVDEIADQIKRDLLEGMDGSGVKAGLIGEIGVAGTEEAPMHRDEEKVLRAAARAQAATGAAISVHPPRKIRGIPSSKLALEILDVLEQEGADLNRVIICHMDRSYYEDLTYQKEIAKRGAYIEYDLWGTENYMERYQDAYQHDMMRVFEVKKLLDEGCADRLLFGHDVFMKIQRTRYGGYGYGHVLRNVVPMLKLEGISDLQIRKILVDNPRRVLTIA